MSSNSVSPFANENKNASGFADAPKTGGRRTRRRTQGGRRTRQSRRQTQGGRRTRQSRRRTQGGRRNRRQTQGG